MELIINVKSVADRTTSNGKHVQDVIDQGDVKYTNWGKPMQAGLSYKCVVEEKQNGQYTNRTIKSFQPMSEAVPAPTPTPAQATAKPSVIVPQQPNGQETGMFYKALFDLLASGYFPPPVAEQLGNILISRALHKTNIEFDYIGEMTKYKLSKSKGKDKTKEPEVIETVGTVEDAAHLFK